MLEKLLGVYGPCWYNFEILYTSGSLVRGWGVCREIFGKRDVWTIKVQSPFGPKSMCWLSFELCRYVALAHMFCDPSSDLA